MFDRGDVTNEVSEEIDNDLSDEDKSSRKKCCSHVVPYYIFYKWEFARGESLYYIRDESVAVQMHDARKVLYEGDLYSLTTVTKKIMGIENGSLQPTPYWTYAGENLQDIYNKTYPLGD